MVTISAHDIVVHYMEKKAKILNVNLDVYYYIDLLNDLCEKALNQMPGHLNALLHMRCVIPKTLDCINVCDDKSVLQMFKVHEKEVVISLYVSHIDIIPPEDVDSQVRI